MKLISTNQKNALIIGVVLMVAIIAIFTYNYFIVKSNWQTIRAIKFESSTSIQLNVSDNNYSGIEESNQYYVCESECSPLVVSHVEIHPSSESTLNIIFSTDGIGKNQISNIPMKSVKIDKATRVLHIRN